jgi:glycosyltransferase involved in cell wall biosynthesis
MRVLVWHVHGSWTTSFVQGDHDYLLPVTPARGPDGLGRAETWDWPRRAVEVPVDKLGEADFDVAVLQRPHEIDLVREWTGRRPGRDVPALYVEHNTPGGDVPFTRHPLADQAEIPVVHVTHFNRLFWDCGSTPTDVIEHGIVDPGHLYTGDWCRAGVVVNDPIRRGRAVGTDLVGLLAETVPVDVFGLEVDGLDRELGLDSSRMWTFQGLSQKTMHRELARRRVYVHTPRWTSLGLSLLEAMHLGMPVVALATTETPAAVPPEAGVLTTRPEEMIRAVWRLVHDTDEAHALGAAAREAALARYGLGRFLADWDVRLHQAVAGDSVGPRGEMVEATEGQRSR